MNSYKVNLHFHIIPIQHYEPIKNGQLAVYKNDDDEKNERWIENDSVDHNNRWDLFLCRTSALQRKIQVRLSFKKKDELTHYA